MGRFAKMDALALMALCCLVPPMQANATTVFVSNEKDNTVTVVDGDSLEVIKTIKTSRRPRGMVLTPDFKLSPVSIPETV